MRADEILGEVGARLRQLGGEADWLQVFTPDIAQALSRLLPAEYEEFKTLLEGSVLLEGWKLEGLTEKTLDLLVFAVRVRQEKEASAVPLEHCCPGAPGAKGLMVPGGWKVAPDRVAFLGGLPAAFGAVYADGRCLDAERGRSYLRLVVCADGEWRLALVRADTSDTRLVAAVKNLGVFIECSKTLAAHLRSFWSLNWNRLPLVKAPVEGEVVFEVWRDFVEANASRFLGDWGALRKGELLMLPDVLRRFLGGHGARRSPRRFPPGGGRGMSSLRRTVC